MNVCLIYLMYLTLQSGLKQTKHISPKPVKIGFLFSHDMTNSYISLSVCSAGVNIFSFMMDPRSKERATVQERESATSILKRCDNHKLLLSISFYFKPQILVL